MIDSYRLLLNQAALLYEKHEAGRPKPFNVFSVLRLERDEVNLHSRFLHALLDYKKPAGENRENLTDFLRHVGVKDFEQRGIRVEKPERYRIDILITNDSRPRQAVVIENKIGAGDQPKQLCRYYNTLKDKGYGNIHVLHLTLNGDKPSEHSFCGCHCEARSYEAISYKNTLPDWLEGCQQHAYDEPGLRESIAQYRHLIRKLTGTNFEEAYMKALTELCLVGENLLLVHDLWSVAGIEAKIVLLGQLWCEVDAALEEEITDLPTTVPPIDPDFKKYHAFEDERIRHFFTGKEDRYHALFYPFGNGTAALAVEAGSRDGLIFGVYCDKAKYQQLHDQLSTALGHMPGKTSASWSRYQEDSGLNLKNATRNDLELLLSEANRREYAERIARDLEPFWEAVKNAGLAGQNG